LIEHLAFTLTQLVDGGIEGGGVEPGTETGLGRARVLAGKRLHEGILSYIGSVVGVSEQSRGQVKHLVEVALIEDGEGPLVALEGLHHQLFID
jgi:hypothetical protein